MASNRKPETRQVEKVLLALLGLGIGHVVLYLCLTGDARTALDGLHAAWKPAELQAAKAPGVMPEPGTSAYSTWLRGYERSAAAKDYELHARHESLMRYGMLLSFLIAAGFLGAAMRRVVVSSKRQAVRSRPRTRPRTPQRAVRVVRALPQPARRYRRSA